MGTHPNLGLRGGEAISASYFTAGGQLFVSTAAGRAAILNPGTEGQLLKIVSGAPTWASVPDVRTAVVTSDVTHAQSSSSLSDVTGLAVAIGASATERWLIELVLLVNATSGTPDIKYGWTYPTGLTMTWGHHSTLAAAGSLTAQTTLGSTPVAALTETSTPTEASLNGTLIRGFVGLALSGGTAGNLQLQFAQNTPDASNLVIKAGSVLRATKLAA